MPGKHETAALDRLRAAARLRLSVTAAADAEADLLMASDMLGALRAAAALLMAAEEIEDAAKACAARLRAALAEVMADTGATGVDLPHHRVSLVDGKASVVIVDEAAIPAEYMEQPPPKPNKARIAAALKAGPVPGAMLGNPAAHIRITAKKDAAA